MVSFETWSLTDSGAHLFSETSGTQSLDVSVSVHAALGQTSGFILFTEAGIRPHACTASIYQLSRLFSLAIPYPTEALGENGPPLDLGPANVLPDVSFDICKVGMPAGKGSLVLEGSGS